MLTGVAVGGPRDGIKLSAGVGWTGHVRDRRVVKPGSSKVINFPGRYIWCDGTWIWKVEVAGVLAGSQAA